MFITHLAVRNFRSLVNIELPLRKLNVMIGPNGSGKTALIEVLIFLHRGSQGELSTFFEERGGYQSVVSQINGRPDNPNLAISSGVSPNNHRSDAKEEYSIELRTTANGYEVTRELFRSHGTSRRYQIVFDYTTERTARPDTAKSQFAELGLSEIRPTEPILSQIPTGNIRYRTVPRFRKFLSASRFYPALDVTARSPVRLPQALTPAVVPGVDGTGLYSTLYNLRTNKPDLYDRLLSNLRQAFSGLNRLEFPVVGAGIVTLAWYDKYCRQPFYPNQLSEGTLRFLWLTTLVLTATRSSLLLIDEPEISLHPELLRILAILLQEASLETQIFVATHSSDLIGWLQPDEVLIADKEDGQTRFTWADTLNLQNWLAEYTLRDLWLMGNLGGRP